MIDQLNGIKAVVFDMYFTLVYMHNVMVSPVLAEALRVQIHQVRQAKHDLSKAYELGQILPDERMLELCQRVGRWDVPDYQIRGLIHAEIKACLMGSDTYPGSFGALRELRTRGYQLGLCSNANPVGVATAKHFGLTVLTDAAVFSCEVGAMKPDAAIYQAIIDALNVTPEQCLFVGDGGSSELAGAKKFGMTTCLVDHPDGYAATHPDENIRADYRIRIVSHVADLLPRPATIK